MSTFRECRSMFDAAVKSYQSGDLANARAAFGRLTVENPDMSDGWLGLLACGDHHLDTLAGAHQHSEALYSETRRVGLTDGELSAVVMAPMYLGLRVWSRATIGLAYASALIIADRHDEAAATLDDPVITEDTGAAQYRQFVMATLFHKTRSWSNLLKVTEISPPSGATDVRDEVADAVAALASTAAASLGQFQFALELAEQVSTTNPRVTADVTLTRAWCLRELGDDDAARVALSATTTGDAPRTNTTAEQAGSPQPKFRHPYDDGRDLLVARRRPPAGDGWRKAVTKMWSQDKVSTKMLAERIGVSASTASESIRKLAEQGLVDHEKYGAVTLTDSGRRAALAMVRRHRLLETFLVNELGYRWDEVHDEAEVLEHAVSDRLMARIDAKLGFPQRDPHGDPIPGADGQVPTPPARQLWACRDGDTGTVARISDADPQMLRYFASIGISLDSRLRVLARREFAGMISVAIDSADGATVDLGSPAAQAIWVVS